jgi:predicted lysophospholipase L1 biosynthesis ABC-type transport system permease subunit
VEAGRDIANGDTRWSPRVVVVNGALARRYFGSALAAVGARLDLWGSERTIVGVVGDVKDAPWDGAAQPALYFPKAQQTVGGDMVLVVRTEGEPATLVAPLQQVLRQLDPALPLANVRTLEAVAASTFAGRRFALALCAAFAFTAVFLALVGTYGVMAQSVAQRAREFGVRQALGAKPADIRRMVLGSGAAIGAVGIVTGGLMALAATRILTSMLYETEATDVPTYVVVAGLLLGVSLLGSYLPARQGMRADPIQALRE